jgi:hypothetical protein
LPQAAGGAAGYQTEAMGSLRPGVGVLVLAAAALAGCGSATAPPTSALSPTTPPSSAAVTTVTTQPATTAPATTEPADCLAAYGFPEPLLAMRDLYEPFLSTADLDGDGDPDVLLTRLHFQTTDTFAVEIYLHDGDRLREATPGIFANGVPTVQHPTNQVIADFNGDGVDDVFLADSGRDLNPFPGYQNALVLSAPGGTLVDGTPGLPQQRDYSHSAAAADVDGDGDVDLYIGNIWGGENGGVGPQIWLNDGSGRFTISPGALPAMIADRDFGAYLTEEFADLDGDGDADLILGDAGDDLAGGAANLVLGNDGSGRFTTIPNAMPPKLGTADLVHDIAVLDLDSDGDLDAVLVSQRPSGESEVQLVLNRGDATFEDATADLIDPMTPPVWVRRLDLFDLDHDGDLDLIARPWDDQDPDPILWMNQDGHLTLTDFDFGLHNLYYDFTDWDGDGGVDVVEAGFALHRQGECG